jgi:hypothetical protein
LFASLKTRIGRTAAKVKGGSGGFDQKEGKVAELDGQFVEKVSKSCLKHWILKSFIYSGKK